MIVRPGVDLVAERLKALSVRLDQHSSLGGKIQVYDGSMPATAGGSIGSSVLLVTLVFPKPSYLGFSAGVSSLHPPDTAIAVGTGTPTWARWTDGGNNFVMDSDAGDMASDAVVRVLDELGGSMIYAGGNITVTLAQSSEV